MKSVKWEARTLKKKLVGFDGHTIYRVYIEGQNKVIRVKNLKIFYDITSKLTIIFPNFEGKLIFDKVQISDEQVPFDKTSASDEKKANTRRPP